jgi:hypothetical protein
VFLEKKKTRFIIFYSLFCSHLPQTVVSGEAEPDSIVLRRDERSGEIKLESFTLGQKGTVMRMDGEHIVL